MKIAVIGADGQLGCDIINDLIYNSIEHIALTEKEIDITKRESVKLALDNIDFEIIVNCAAYTDVAGCETNEISAFNVNSIGVKHIAEYANIHNKTICHISTDYVFDGKKGTLYNENDLPSPLNVYGLSKLGGEIFLQNYCSKSIIIRTAGLYGKHKSVTKKYNFVSLMLQKAKNNEKIRVVSDEYVTPTYTPDLSRQIIHLLKNFNEYGIYHAVCNGYCSWYEFAKKIFEIKNMDVDLAPVSVNEFKTNVARPLFSALENKKLKDLQLNIMRDWEVALSDYLTSVDSK